MRHKYLIVFKEMTVTWCRITFVSGQRMCSPGHISLGLVDAASKVDGPSHSLQLSTPHVMSSRR